MHLHLRPPHPSLDLHYALAELLGIGAIELARYVHQAFRIEPRRRPAKGGRTLRPGNDTPLWNEFRLQIRPHLRKYGRQANLGRLLGLPRQRVNAFVTSGREMPDAERTLQLLVWLALVRSGRPPS
jgi:hypothetical protein